MAEPEKEIAQLEALLRRLEKEYDQFLSGQLRREPAETENALLAIVRGSGARAIQNPTLAFRFNSLVARYNSFKTVWTRRQREMEEGRGPAARRPPSPGAPRQGLDEPAPVERHTEYVASDPRHETRHLQNLFATYRAMREKAGEPVEKLRPESFERALADKVDQLKRQHGCEAVLIRLVSDQGKTRIVAKPFRRGRAGGAA